MAVFEGGSAGFVARWRPRMSGLALALLLGAGALLLAQVAPLPATMVALLGGALCRPLLGGQALAPGAQVAAGQVLRLGVPLLALRLDGGTVTQLGWPTALAMGAVVSLTLGFGLALGRLLRLPAAHSIVIAASCAICGAAAALAVSAVTPERPGRERLAALAVAAAAVLSTLAMVVLPGIVLATGLSPRQSGLFLGTAIADVAQVAGAAYALSPQVGDLGIAVKLTRVLYLAPVVLLTALAFRRGGSARRALPPPFVIAFFILAAASVLGLPSTELRTSARLVSDFCLASAVAGVALAIPVRGLLAEGARPLALSAAAMTFVTLSAAVTAILCQ